jgi:glycosyl transferase family 25
MESSSADVTFAGVAHCWKAGMLVLINLDSAVERRVRMAEQLDAQGLTWQRIGIDLRRTPHTQVAAELASRFPSLCFDVRRLSGAELGCWASHLTAWQTLLASDAPSCAVIEDDLVLDRGFAAAVAALCAAPGLDLVYLGTSSRNISQRRRVDVGGFAVHTPVGVIFNTWGYVVRREWTRRFFAAGGDIDLPIDHFLGGRARWCPPAIGVLQPTVVGEDPQLGRASQIGPHTKRLDRASWIDDLRRAVLGSRVSDLYYRTVYRLL